MKLSLIAVSAALLCACSSGPPTRSPDDGTATEVGEAELRGAAAAGRQTYRALREVAPNVTLAILGEDDGDPCTASFRVGPAAELSAREALRLFGFNVEKQLAAASFSFNIQDPHDKAEFWKAFADSQDDPVAAQKVVSILSAPEVLGLATMTVDDDKSFSAPAFLIALMSDKSLVALRGTVGGMSF